MQKNILWLLFIVLDSPIYGEYWSDYDKSDWKDPRYRDEDISHTRIKAHVKRVDGLYHYVYEIFSPLENKGVFSDINIDVACDLDFGVIESPWLSSAEDQSDGKHVPVGGVGSVIVRRGNSVNMSFAAIKPGEATNRLLVAPSPPEEREYRLAPDLDNLGWRYDLYPEGKWTIDFVVRGKTLGPGCTLDFQPKLEWFGAKEEPLGINRLLGYSEPNTDEVLLNNGWDDAVITLFYDAGIDPATFRAEADDKDISHLFKPVPATSETVKISNRGWGNQSLIVLSVLGTITDENNEGKSLDIDIFKVKVDRYYITFK